MNKKPSQVLTELNHKFNGNFEEWKSLGDHDLERSFLGLHCISSAGEALHSRSSSTHHKICCRIFDEIFSDGVAAIYLACNAMEKPACIVLRRVLELGLAAIYLWDMPHAAIAWEQQDQDLSFTEMLKHINSKGYVSYVSQENGIGIDGEILPSGKAQSLYRSLSDIVHGKIATFETSMPNRFKFEEKDWREFILTLNRVIELLVNALLTRFKIRDEVFQKHPQARKEFG